MVSYICWQMFDFVLLMQDVVHLKPFMVLSENVWRWLTTKQRWQQNLRKLEELKFDLGLNRWSKQVRTLFTKKIVLHISHAGEWLNDEWDGMRNKGGPTWKTIRYSINGNCGISYRLTAVFLLIYHRLCWFIIIIIIYPLTMRVVGAPQMISQSVSSIFPVLHCPLGLGKLQACPFPDVIFPPLPPSSLSSSSFHCALQDGFG